ncbi:MAG: hypothetical protein MN733_33310 [Nitrososphaera sp.]|nr:hypothetical protein [Nitrososphaera sp.]
MKVYAYLLLLILPLQFPVFKNLPLECFPEPPALNRFEIQKQWKENNTLWFKGKMATVKLENIHYVQMDDILAVVTCDAGEAVELFFNKRLQFSERLLRWSLLHEQAHVSVNDCTHGAYFTAEVKRLVKVGAFDDIF